MMPDPLIAVSYELVLADRGDCWTGRIEPLGITVYGDSPNAAQVRADEMMQFIVDVFHTDFTTQDLSAYFNDRGVDHQIMAWSELHNRMQGSNVLSMIEDTGKDRPGIPALQNAEMRFKRSGVLPGV